MRGRQRLLSLSMLVATGCSDPLGPFRSPDVEPDVEPDDGCDISVVSTWPADGSASAYHRDPIEFVLSAPDPGAEVDGPVPGVTEIADDGRLVRFLPGAPLAPETTYAFGLDYCGGRPEISFTTSDYGAPLDDPGALVGTTFATDIAGARWTVGGGLGDLLAGVLDRLVLVGVTAVDGSTLSARVAIGERGGEDAPDPCARTVDIADVDFSDAPFFALAAESVSWDAWEGSMEPRDFMLRGTIAPDLTGVGGLTLSAVLDLRDLVSALELTSPELACELAENLGAQCGPCPDDGAVACVALAGDRFEAWAVDGPLARVSAAAEDCG